jgi:hypothetical protein
MFWSCWFFRLLDLIRNLGNEKAALGAAGTRTSEAGVR